MESAVSSSFKETNADLSNSGKPLSSVKLIFMSNLNLAEMVLFEETWATIGVRRRQQIMSRLIEIAEDNFELNFDNIFRHNLKDKDAEVRCKAIEGLWENEEASLIAPLINLLERDSSEKVQAAAAGALGKFDMLAELNKLRPPNMYRMFQALLSVINDKCKPLEVRCRALEAVAPLSIPEVTTAIMDAYYNDNSKMRASAVYAMGKNCDPSWLPILLAELYSAKDEIRYKAAEACGELGQEAAIAHLIKLTSDPCINVQLSAIRALGEIGGTTAKEQLEKYLNHPSEPVRDAAEQTLDGLKTREDPLSF